MNNIKLDLKARLDADKQTYFVAKLQGPFSINCEDGVAFLVFISDQGEEQLQIAPFDHKDKANYNK